MRRLAGHGCAEGAHSRKALLPIASSSIAAHDAAMSLPSLPDPVPPASHHGMVVNCVAYRGDGTRIGDITLDAISDILQEPGTFVWVGLHEPDAALLLKLQEEFDLHDLAVEDAHKAHQRTKLEAYGDSLFLVVQTAQVVEVHLAFG